MHLELKILPLCHRWDSRSSGNLDLGRDIAIGVLLRTVTRDVTSFATLIAGLASSVQGATVRCRAVSGNVAELPTGVALHSLSLAVTRKVVRTTTLVAGSRSRATSETASAETTVSTTADGPTSSHSNTGWVGAGSGQVTGLSAVIAATVATSTAQP
ncbi:hypothetical protein K449DRAFT_18440 [Hypoxylon sp. EC38]|nr:hypothetical protein K449DRAFT_18440 [Hypoxylon sp. EC38]